MGQLLSIGASLGVLVLSQLRSLIKGDFKWTPAAAKAFAEIKQKLTEAFASVQYIITEAS